MVTEKDEREKRNNFMCFFYFTPAKWTFRLRQGTKWKTWQEWRNYITTALNRYLDTGRQLYFNLLGEYTNNQFRLWRKVDAAFCCCFQLFIDADPERGDEKVHWLAIWFVARTEGKLKLPITSHLRVRCAWKDVESFISIFSIAHWKVIWRWC